MDSRAGKCCRTFLSLLPFMFYLVGRAYDYYLDLIFALEFRDKYVDRQNVTGLDGTFGLEGSNLTGLNATVGMEGGNLTKILHSPEDFFAAFITSIISMVSSYLFLGIIIALVISLHTDELYKDFDSRCIEICGNLCLWLAIIILPFFYIPLIFCITVVHKCMHGLVERKDEYSSMLRWLEYLWAAYGMFETCIEACFQLMLQAWLLSVHMGVLKDLGFLGCIHAASQGVASFFWICDIGEDDVAKSLGKAFMSAVFTASSYGSCTKMMKGDAMALLDDSFLKLSAFLQLAASFLSLMVFLYVLESIYALLLLYVLRFGLVLWIKWTFERTSQDNGAISVFITFINALGSSLVYMKLHSYSFREESPKTRKCERSTFLEQSLYSGTVFLINLFLITIAGCVDGYNGLSDSKSFLGPEDYAFCALIVTLLHVLAVCFKWIYYSFYGHPWKELNGPQKKINEEQLGHFYECRKDKICSSKRIPLSNKFA